MQSKATTVEAYMKELPADRQKAINNLRKIILKNMPKGFKEEMSYGMIGYVIPHKLYPKGYHCNPSLPLPFMNIASQKNFIAVYHMGIYASKPLMDWFIKEYAKSTTIKLDMGKSCIRFKDPESIPFTLIGELAAKVQAADWINLYESMLKK